jgi:hypothetical protein
MVIFLKKKDTNTNNINMSSIPPPIYDGKESIVSYMRRVDDYKMLIKKEKYNAILDFVNIILKKEPKLKNLTDFKNIKLSLLTMDNKEFKKILKLHGQNLINTLGINKTVDYDVDSDKITSDDIISFIKKCVDIIEYSVIIKKDSFSIISTQIKKYSQSRDSL